jgi:hypothetical protein
VRHAERGEYGEYDQQVVSRCPKFLGLLSEFYGEMAAPPPIEAALVAPETMPQPQRSLLVHDHDMTSTLVRFHGEPITLRVLDSKRSGDYYRRHIVLQAARSGRPVEYGAIRVNLSRLAAPVEAEVLQARGPLGGILSTYGITFRCCPGAYFKILSNALIGRSLELDAPAWLFGRCNCLSDAGGRTIAEVIEILPPEDSRSPPEMPRNTKPA